MIAQPQGAAEAAAAGSDMPAIRNYRDAMDDAEKAYLARVLTAAGGNKSQAARIAGLTRETLSKKLDRYRVTVSVVLA